MPAYRSLLLLTAAAMAVLMSSGLAQDTDSYDGFKMPPLSVQEDQP